ncbi:cyclic nucleotide-binding domain-containing protein [Phenylobacterium sp.]|uniref:cyclic nucleotide-binding domain-containing protein n=1 Tax=Phenylobacterium sp. TaxID=1871053 RepID=UPI001212457D|nr:cyclic nucleotide-binding domain-containing protein [Phenylobacterium sp.]TAL29377.1 MAG: cyclic nucleotide-binding domain-containing protein [Phenylobacterium sp.]
MSETYKIAIIGSGPAGMSAAARAAKKGISHILLEKTDHLSDTIFRYQKGKHVMATPSVLVLRAECEFDAGKREKILDQWNADTKAAGVNVKFNADVTAITGDKGDFTIQLKKGDPIKAENIVLAVGTQGNPNLMRCEGGNLPHVQYQLDDPGEYTDEHIFVIGGGDAGIENAMGLIADAGQNNTVTLVNRGADFPTAKKPNVDGLLAARDAGRISVLTETNTALVEPGWITVDTPQGQSRFKCDRIIARMGAAPPRAFVEAAGVEFSSPDRTAFPTLTPTFESTSKPGIYVIGALAGYPLIKHCMNQGYDVVEFISGNTNLEPADEPLLVEKLKGLPGKRSVAEWLEFLRSNVEILNGLSPLQMREFLLDSTVRSYKAGDPIFVRNEPGSSLFGIAEGSVNVEVDPNNAKITVPIGKSSIFGEVGLISGRKRGATIRAAEPTICVEIPRMAALKLMSQVPQARETVNRITTERQVLQIFKSGLTPADIQEVLAGSEVIEVKPGEAIIKEGDISDDLYIIRSGSMIVEKDLGGKPVFMSYVPAGSYSGEMAMIERAPRVATVKAAIRSTVVKLPADPFRKLLVRKPELAKRMTDEMRARREINAFIEEQKDEFGGAVDMYSSVANFLIKQGIGEATDVLLIDESLCVGCDNCEKACADSHDGLSRLNREAGTTFANIHVPTSCRHCEHPHCMSDCPPNAIRRGPDGEVFINETCIGCGNCQRACPYGVIQMDKPPPKKPPLWEWMLFGKGPGPGQPSYEWRKKAAKAEGGESPKLAIKCDMCSGKAGGPACVRACPTGAAIRVTPDAFLSVARLEKTG